MIEVTATAKAKPVEVESVTLVMDYETARFVMGAMHRECRSVAMHSPDNCRPSAVWHAIKAAISV